MTRVLMVLALGLAPHREAPQLNHPITQSRGFTQAAGPVQAQPSAPAAPAPAQAYYEFMLARHLESQGDDSGALEALKRALAADPKSADIRAEFAGFYARQNKGPEAVDSAEQALKLDPDNTEAHRILGLVFSAWSEGGVTPPPGRSQAQLRTAAIEHLTKILGTPGIATDLNMQLTLARLQVRAGRPELAIPVLENIVSQSPYVVEPYALLADARLAVGRVADAAAALERAAEIDPRRFVTLAELHERQGNWAEAAEAYGKAVASVRGVSRDVRLRWIAALLNVPGEQGAVKAREGLQAFLATTPQDARALYLLSTANRTLGDLPGAEAAARKLLALDPTSVSGLYALALVLFERHEPRQVVELLTPFEKDVAARGKGNEAEAARVLSQLGIAHLQLGAGQQAIAAFTTARTFAPTDPVYDAYLVQALLSARQHARAIDLSAEALARYPGEERLIRLRAQALAGAGRHDEAITLLQEAVAGAPDDEGVAMALGAAFETAGRVEDAERVFRRLIERDPLNADALNYLGYMLADRGQRLPEAVALIERALKVDPDNPAFLDSLGWALFKQGKAEEAEAPLRKAAATLLAQSVIQDHFGDVLARRGKSDEAIAAWERALTGDGEGIDRAAIDKKIKDARGRRK